jgi:hypothetical protein
MARGPLCGGHLGVHRRSPACRGAGGRHAWLLSLGLLAGGVFTAHALAYRLAVPDPEHRHHLLEETGHGYVDGSLLASVCIAIVAAGFAGRVAGGALGSPHPPLWLFGLAPPLGFAVQEHVERWFHDGAFPAGAALEPTFLAGLLLQLPFALAAALAAAALLAGAEALATRLGRFPRLRVLPGPPSLPAPAEPGIRPARARVGARGQRAPPLLPPSLI